MDGEAFKVAGAKFLIMVVGGSFAGRQTGALVLPAMEPELRPHQRVRENRWDLRDRAWRENRLNFRQTRALFPGDYTAVPASRKFLLMG